ncbi:hypothetical protein MSIMFB_02542 [Mycobacterium simulans]|uniref:Uncharacterized protein n=1 Tax=Mycobacterium simulans TaxID=627089 RepID=A0A7Z7N9U6_9MYCO|nr:hypothetical protein [Mycobacterium simulans]SOJ55052.1 hypothetical protein MSIMFB_02542 [Mycobacterium simulans]
MSGPGNPGHWESPLTCPESWGDGGEVSMVTVFERTHCVLDPDQRYGAAVPLTPQTAALP